MAEFVDRFGGIPVDPDNGDYHLKSQRGRYWPNHDLWVLDDTTSPGVDAGDPNSDSTGESMKWVVSCNKLL